MTMGREDDVQVLVAKDDEDWLNAAFCERPAPFPSKPTRQKREIGIDEILKDRLRKKKRGEGKKGPKGKGKKERAAELCRSSDDSDAEDDKYSAVEKVVEECQNQVLNDTGALAAADMSRWGRQLFVGRKEGPSPPIVLVGNGVLGGLWKILPVADPVELLIGNHLLTAATLWGNLDEQTARWVFHHLCFSTNQAVEESACDMLCTFAGFLSSSSGLSQPSSFSVSAWRPGGELFLSAFRNLGYVEYNGDVSTPVAGSSGDASPRNMRSMLKFLAACSKAPEFASFCVTEVEQLVVLLAEFIADRQLQGLLHLVFCCLESLVDYVKEEDWGSASDNIISELAGRCPTNQVFVTAYLTSHYRICQMQNRMMLLLLSTYANRCVSSADDVASIFKHVNLKKATSLVDLYHQLVLADMWFWRVSFVGAANKSARRAWVAFLRLCSSQIQCSDVRMYATKVRNRASFLCQKYLCAESDLPNLDHIPEEEYL